MSYKHRYTVRSINPPHANNVATWAVIKFDRDLNPEGQYTVSQMHTPKGHHMLCDCFASNKPICRHRAIVEEFRSKDRVDTGATYDFDRDTWFAPPPNEM